MRTWRRVAFLSVLAWLLFVALWANRTWTESVPVTVPPGAAADERTFECSAPFRAKEVRPKEPLAADVALEHGPCEEHGQRRVLAVFDIAVGGTALVLLAYRRARSALSADPTEADLAG